MKYKYSTVVFQSFKMTKKMTPGKLERQNQKYNCTLLDNQGTRQEIM